MHFVLWAGKQERSHCLETALKCVVAVVVVHLIYGKTHTDMMPLLSMYAGMGAVLGHNYPFYLKFKAEKV